MRAKPASRVAWMFLAPGALLYAVLVLYPMAASLAVSMTDWNGIAGSAHFVGLNNYRAILFDDPVSRLAFRNTLIWTAVNVIVPVSLGLLLAVALNGSIRFRTALRAIFYCPSVLPLIAVGLIWAWVYNPHFGVFGRGWLSDFSTALPAVLIASVWQSTGFPMLLYLAGLQGIPREQYEAAELDGAGPVRRFWHVTLPWLRETHIIAISLSVLASFRAFDLVYAMTYGGPGRATQVLGTWMYFNTFQYKQAGMGSAIAWSILILSAAVTIPYIRLTAKGVRR
jgi:raffinose/stachyose/melibiose transport system permease protein